MRKTLTALLMLVALAAAAQNKKSNEINEKLFDAKVSELVYRLDMSDDQKQKFIPIYRRYNQDMRAAWGERQKPAKATTDEERLARAKQRMERQQRAQSVRLKYIDEFATVLSAKQVNQFFEAEGKIQKKLMDRKNHKRGMKGMKNGKGKRMRPDAANQQSKDK